MNFRTAFVLSSLFLALSGQSFAQAPAASAPAASAQAASAPAASAAAVAKPAAPAKPDLAKGEAIFTQVCASCHGADGNSGTPANPKLAGQHPEYIAKQLREYKSGKRNNAIMKGFATALSDDDMRNIAYWVSAKAPKAGFAKDKELVALGERIYRGGVSERGIAACMGCHSPNGAGMPSQYPRLSGQHADYTEAQLRGFRDGARKNNTVMTQAVAKLNDKELKALADYVAGLR